MNRTEYEAEVAHLMNANAVTLDRLVYRSNVGVYGDDSGARTETLINRMERTIQQREAAIRNLTAQFVTGHRTMGDFYKSLGQGPYKGYRPSLSREVLCDMAVEQMVEAWKGRFQTEPFIY